MRYWGGVRTGDLQFRHAARGRSPHATPDIGRPRSTGSTSTTTTRPGAIGPVAASLHAHPETCGHRPRRIHLSPTPVRHLIPGRGRPRAEPAPSRSPSSFETCGRTAPRPRFSSTATGTARLHGQIALDPNAVTGNTTSREDYTQVGQTSQRPLALRRPGTVGSDRELHIRRSPCVGTFLSEQPVNGQQRRTSPTRSARTRRSSRSCSAAALQSRTPRRSRPEPGVHVAFTTGDR